MAMHHGMFSDPIYLGDWPAAVIERVPYLQRFTPDQVEALCCAYLAAGLSPPVPKLLGL